MLKLQCFNNIYTQKSFTVKRQDILGLLQRRPCSLDDIASGLDIHLNEAVKYIEDLNSEGKIDVDTQNNKLYYTASAPNNT